MFENITKEIRRVAGRLCHTFGTRNSPDLCTLARWVIKRRRTGNTLHTHSTSSFLVVASSPTLFQSAIDSISPSSFESWDAATAAQTRGLSCGCYVNIIGMIYGWYGNYSITPGPFWMEPNWIEVGYGLLSRRLKKRISMFIKIWFFILLGNHPNSVTYTYSLTGIYSLFINVP